MMKASYCEAILHIIKTMSKRNGQFLVVETKVHNFNMHYSQETKTLKQVMSWVVDDGEKRVWGMVGMSYK